MPRRVALSIWELNDVPRTGSEGCSYEEGGTE
jgi:hypothetical protein